MHTICCIGTGPSLTLDQIDSARAKGYDLYACNNAIFMAPDAKLLYAVNIAWWDWYWESVKAMPCQKWSTNLKAKWRYGVNWVAEKNAPGLSRDPNVIHHGHGSGFSLVSMAWQARPDRIVLLGYDLKYAPDYDPANKNPGSTPRHFFGEYPQSMRHWPSKMVKDGVHIELREQYRSVAEQGLVEIVNCTPGSAIDCFPMCDIGELE